jgi:hypothetical protein
MRTRGVCSGTAPEVPLAEVVVEPLVEVGGQEDGGAAKAVDQGLRDLVLL